MSGCFEDKGLDAELERKADRQIEPMTLQTLPKRCPRCEIVVVATIPDELWGPCCSVCGYPLYKKKGAW
jgi:ribosomal protein S27AE